MKTIYLTVAVNILAFSFSPSLWAQTADVPAKAPAPAKRSQPAEKPKLDLDGFFKKAEKQTRDEYARGGNCLPKPKDHTQKDPVS